MKIVCCFSGSETSELVSWGPGVGAALWDFNSNDSNEMFRHMFANVKIRETKIWGLEELKILLRVVEKRIINIYKS